VPSTPTGTDPAQIEISGKEKDDLIAVAPVSAAGLKFPLFLIAKGKPTICEHG
jgi:hypothetical protein